MWFEVERLAKFPGEVPQEITIKTQSVVGFYIDNNTSDLVVQANDDYYKVLSIPSINPNNNTPILGPTHEQFRNFMILADSYDSGHEGALLKDYMLTKSSKGSEISPKSPKEMLKGIEFEE